MSKNLVNGMGLISRTIKEGAMFPGKFLLINVYITS